MILKDSEAARERASHIIAAGGMIGFRTDTFYGLGADPLNSKAVSRIRKLKSREEQKPILLVIADLSEVERFIVDVSDLFRTVARRHWPGAITLIGIARPELPLDLTAGTGTIGLRLPANEDVRNLVRACGGALTATSANLSGRPPAQAAIEVRSYFPNGIDLIIDSGEVATTLPSTVLDLSSAKPRLIRAGAIKVAEIEATLLAAGSESLS